MVLAGMPGAVMTPLRRATMTVAGTSVAKKNSEAKAKRTSFRRTVLIVSRVCGRNRAKKASARQISDETADAAATAPPEPSRSWTCRVAIGSVCFVSCLLSYALWNGETHTASVD